MVHLRDIAFRNALLVFITHVLFVSVSLVPGVRELPLAASVRVADQGDYLLIAENLQQCIKEDCTHPTILTSALRTPGYPFVIFLSLAITGSYIPVFYLQVFLAAIACWCLTRLIKKLNFNEQIQKTAGVLFAFLPNSPGLCATLLTDGLSAYLFVMWTYALLSFWKQQQNKYLWAAVALTPVLLSIRPLFMLLILVLVVLWFAIRFRHTLSILVIVLTVALSTGILIFKNYYYQRAFTPSTIGVAGIRNMTQARYIARKEHRPLKQVEDSIREADQQQLALRKKSEPDLTLYQLKKDEADKFLRAFPVEVVGQCAEEALKQTFAPQSLAALVLVHQLSRPAMGFWFAVQMVFMLLIVAGIKPVWRADYRLLVLILVCFIVFTGAHSLVYYIGARLRFFIDLLMLPLAACGFSYLKEWYHHKFTKK